MKYFLKIRYALSTAFIFILHGAAHSQALPPVTGGGWITASNNVKSLGDSLVIAMVVLCAVGGVGAIAFAGKLLLKKAGERGEDVEMSKVGYAILGGAFLLSVSYIASTSVETLGGSSADIGKSIPITTR